MANRIVLAIYGDLSSTLYATFELWENGERVEQISNIRILQPNSDLQQQYRNWEANYHQTECRYWRELRLEHELDDEGDDFSSNFGNNLIDSFNEWLNSQPSQFRHVKYKLIGELKSSRHQDIDLIIQTDNPILQRLPWHEWEIFQKEKSVEVCLIPPNSFMPTTITNTRNNIRILAILGDPTRIDLEEDRRILEQLSGVGEMCILPQPNLNDLSDALEDRQGWDIVLFSGHSHSDRDYKNGTIYINKNEQISIGQLNYALEIMIETGLKLAVFNSCKGLGLANYLASLNIPQVIFFREGVPDKVAHDFLREFLKEFVQGKPLNQAVNRARRILESFHPNLPYVTWLPLIMYQHPSVKPWVLPKPVPLPESSPLLTPSRKVWKQMNWNSKVTRFVVLAVAAFALIVIWFQITINPIGDYVTTGEETIVTSDNSTPESKKKGVDFVAECKQLPLNYLTLINQKTRQRWQNCFWTKSNYEKAFYELRESWKNDGKDPETLIYMNNAMLEGKGVDYYTIAVVVPILKDKYGKIKDADLAKEILRGVAKAQTKFNSEFFKDDYQLNENEEKEVIAELFKNENTKGKGLKVVIADDFNEEKEAIDRAKALSKQSDILGVVGHYASEMTVASVETYKKKNLVLVSPGTTTEDLTYDNHEIFFRTVFNTQLQAEYLAQYLRQNSVKKAVIFYSNDSDFAAPLAVKFKERFRKEDETILEVHQSNLSQSDFDANKAIEELQNKVGTAIVLLPDGQVSEARNHAIQMIQANKGNHLIVGAWSIYSDDILKSADSAEWKGKNLVMIVPWHRGLNPTFSREAKELWRGLISPLTAVSYDATLTLIEALERQLESTETPSRKGMLRELQNPEFSVSQLRAATGKIEFCQGNGDRKKTPAVFVHVDESKEFVPVEDFKAENVDWQECE